MKIFHIYQRLFFFFLFLASNVHCFAQLEFVENKGQWASPVKFRSIVNNGSFFLEKNGFTVAVHKPEDLNAISEAMHGHSHSNKAAPKSSIPLEKLPLRSHAYKVSFFGGNGAAQMLPGRALNSHCNFFLGNDRNKWATDCKLFGEVLYKDVYPNIDVRYYNDGTTLKYDFIVRPGGNPDAIGMRYEGVDGLTTDQGKLIIKTSVGDVKESEPFSYQATVKGQEKVECAYKIEDNIVRFNVKKYDATKTLVIDPTVIFSSFTGSTTDNWGFTATPGPDGSFFAGGISFGTGYPVSTGAYDPTFNGGNSNSVTTGYDIAIFKFSPNGSNRLYATYLGGSGNEQVHSMVADAQGNLIIAGASNSSNYPQVGLSGFADPGASYDIIISKLSPTGSALIGSAKIGGADRDGINIRPKFEGIQGLESIRRNYGDDARSEVILDGSNNVILASSTQSANFPIRGAAIQNSLAGKQDGVILKLTPNLNSIIFSSFFGGTENDACFVLSLNPLNNNIYVGGSTESASLPGNRTGTIGPSFRGATDGFVTIINPTGAVNVIATTYIGTTTNDMLFGLKFDRKGFPYIMGTTNSASWPVTNAAYSNPGAKQFIGKLQPDLSAYVYSTVFGNNSSVPNISPIAFLVDRCENVYISGWGGGINTTDYGQGNTNGLPVTNPIPGIPAPDGQDFYFFVLERNATSRLFASHFGQNGGFGDHVDGGTSRFDEQGVIYQAICANCSRGVVFPTTGGAWATTNGSPNCNQAALKIDMNFAGVGGKVQSSINGVVNDSTACINTEIVFKDLVGNGKKLIFDFGDGTPVRIVTPPTTSVSHTYAVAGTYTVLLIAEDSSTCNIRDTSRLQIFVGANKALLDFVAAKQPPCQSLTYSFTNTTVGSISNNFISNNFYWDYGDGSPRDTINGFAPNPALHTYAQPGTYDVKLFLIGNNFCNSPDSIMKTIRLNPLVDARFTAPVRGCVPFTVKFKNESLAGTSFQYQFETGEIFSTESDPTYIFTNAGTYRVRLIANDPSTCNLSDTSDYLTITVFPIPVANASWSPNPPIENVPVTFTNLSSPDAIRFMWNFGDGSSSTIRNPVHEYDSTGTYEVELLAYNIANCADTFRFQVQVIVLPLLDVPNAFTPGKFGENGVIKVRGFGITKLNFKIYNRWGQLVFQSNDKNIGWDGTFKGKLQPLDVYAYTLDAQLATGEKIRKTGDITLLK